MAGKIKFMIDKIITSKAKRNPTISTFTRTNLILKVIAVDKYTENSPDDVTVLNKITKIAQELDVTL